MRPNRFSTSVTTALTSRACVTSTDFVGHLLDKGAARAAAEGLDIRFQVADAESLPFDEGAFDVVLSTFGVMFTPEHARAAGEMLRVVRRFGRTLGDGIDVRGLVTLERIGSGRHRFRGRDPAAAPAAAPRWS